MPDSDVIRLISQLFKKINSDSNRLLINIDWAFDDVLLIFMNKIGSGPKDEVSFIGDEKR